jgi:hypothetical protein
MELKDVLDDVAEDGWAGLEGLGARRSMMPKMNQEALDDARMVNAALSTPDGRRFIKWLVEQTKLRGEGDDEIAPKDIHLYAVAKAKRAGQNSVVDMILLALRAGEPTEN